LIHFKVSGARLRIPIEDSLQMEAHMKKLVLIATTAAMFAGAGAVSANPVHHHGTPATSHHSSHAGHHAKPCHGHMMHHMHMGGEMGHMSGMQGMGGMDHTGHKGGAGMQGDSQMMGGAHTMGDGKAAPTPAPSPKP
jgi:hypothetical protein